MSSLFGAAPQAFGFAEPEQTEFVIPQSLADKYRPRKLADFVGVHKPRKVMQAFAARPFPTAWFLLGGSGLGKTSMALAVAEEIGGEVHHIPSRNCDLETVESVCRQCHYIPRAGAKGFHVVIVDEADQMSRPAQLAFLSKLDATAFPPQTIFFFTANAKALLEPRFLSRCKELEFRTETLESELIEYLGRIYAQEGGTYALDLAKIARESAFNVRDALGRLEVELMLGDDRSDLPRVPDVPENTFAPIQAPPEPSTAGRVKIQARGIAKNRADAPKGLRKGEKVVLEPFVTSETQIRATYRGQAFEGRILADGHIEVAGKVYNTPTAAAASISRSAQAWSFWKYAKNGQWLPIDELRKGA